jgi:hypothetical protein
LRPRAPAEMTIPLGPPSLTNSSDLPGSDDRTGRPNGRSHAPPYLVLLRAGFCLPRLLPGARCALTAPFHPYLRKQGGIFSVPLSVGSPRPGVTRRTALWSSDFPPRAWRLSRAVAATRRSSGSLRRRSLIRRSPGKSCTAPASCRDCCAACRRLRPSSRCSTRSRAVLPPGRPAPSSP